MGIATLRNTNLHSRQHRLPTAVFSMFLTICLISGVSAVQADSTNPNPSVEYPPQEVVKIVVDALKTNSEADGDTGIATVFRFASPGNRTSTGPLERFAKMIRGGFSDMLNHQGARFDTMEVNDDVAVQAVWLMQDSGVEVGYAFQLGKQKSGEYEGMWMTDTVIPLGKDKRRSI